MMKSRDRSSKEYQKRGYNGRKNKLKLVAVLYVVFAGISCCSLLPVMAQETGIIVPSEASDPSSGSETEQPEVSTGEDAGGTMSSTDESTEVPATETPQNTENPDNTMQNPPADAPPVVVPETPEEEEPNHAPRVIISACTADAEHIEPGMDVIFTVSLKNTSSDKELYNMKVSYESTTGDLTPLESTNSRYIPKVRAGGGSSITFPMHISRDIVNYSQKIIINMEYEDDKAMSYSSSENLYVSIFRPLGFYADNPIVPTAVESGTTANISLNLFNTGKATIYDVYCKLECRGFLESGTYYVGNIASETSATANLLPVASNLQYGTLGDPRGEKYGSVKGKIIITYQDEAGNSYEEEVNINTEITRPADEMEEPEIEKIEYSSQWWVSIVILLVAVDGLVIVLAYYIRKHRV